MLYHELFVSRRDKKKMSDYISRDLKGFVTCGISLGLHVRFLTFEIQIFMLWFYASTSQFRSSLELQIELDDYL